MTKLDKVMTKLPDPVVVAGRIGTALFVGAVVFVTIFLMLP